MTTTFATRFYIHRELFRKRRFIIRKAANVAGYIRRMMLVYVTILSVLNIYSTCYAIMKRVANHANYKSHKYVIDSLKIQTCVG